MKSLLLNIFNIRVVSPWLILLIDLGIVANVFFIHYLFGLSQFLHPFSISELLFNGSIILLVYLCAFLLTGSFRGIIRHSNYSEFKIVITACLSAFITLLVGYEVLAYWGIKLFYAPRFLLIFHFLLTVIVTVGFRIIVKELYTYVTRKHKKQNVLIFGAGEMGQITMEAINSDKDVMYNVVGFIDDDVTKHNTYLHNKCIMSWNKALRLSNSKQIQCVIIAVNGISVKRKQEITERCLDLGWTLKVMPTVRNWVNGISNQQQIRDVRIEDILGREEIVLNQVRITKGLIGQVVLVTGAAGSIGSEIVRQLLRFPVRRVVMVDIAESALYNLQQELLLSHDDAPFDIVLADVTDKYRMEEVFNIFQPDIVFNAAAYKHVPLMESFPYEAIRVNIGGVKVLADLSIRHKVKKFVMVSTDKAVNPTNVMGTSKRICEIYIQALSQLRDIKTSFITTRFGNVLGSNGSVVPLFKRQIENGGPVTVTHEDITRYFMTIPEACQLVLEAGFMGNGGEIFVFDMGEPVKIADLAKEMIRLSGYKVDEDIKIVYTGLRPGEKLFEELLASKENTKPTHHDKILIGNVRDYDFVEVNRNLDELLYALTTENNKLLVSRMKNLVPEFISKNSKYCELDY